MDTMLLLLSLALASECAADGIRKHGWTYEEVTLGPGTTHEICLRAEVSARPLQRWMSLRQGQLQIRVETDVTGCAQVCVPPGTWVASVTTGSACAPPMRSVNTTINPNKRSRRTLLMVPPEVEPLSQAMMQSAVAAPTSVDLMRFRPR